MQELRDDEVATYNMQNVHHATHTMQLCEQQLPRRARAWNASERRELVRCGLAVRPRQLVEQRALTDGREPCIPY
jgi:hypothetical protein